MFLLSSYTILYHWKCRLCRSVCQYFCEIAVVQLEWRYVCWNFKFEASKIKSFIRQNELKSLWISTEYGIKSQMREWRMENENERNVWNGFGKPHAVDFMWFSHDIHISFYILVSCEHNRRLYDEKIYVYIENVLNTMRLNSLSTIKHPKMFTIVHWKLLNGS